MIRVIWTGDGETWRPIPSFPVYSISTWGRIRREVQTNSSKRVGFIIPRALKRGHLQVILSMNNKKSARLVHRLVAEAFLPPPSEGQDCVLHKDDNPANNRPDNLFWGTQQDNIRDMVSKGRQASGSRVKSSKLTDYQVELIRTAIELGATQKLLSEVFGVARSNIHLIASRKTWKSA